MSHHDFRVVVMSQRYRHHPQLHIHGGKNTAGTDAEHREHCLLRPVIADQSEQN